MVRCVIFYKQSVWNFNTHKMKQLAIIDQFPTKSLAQCWSVGTKTRFDFCPTINVPQIIKGIHLLLKVGTIYTIWWITILQTWICLEFLSIPKADSSIQTIHCQSSTIHLCKSQLLRHVTRCQKSFLTTIWLKVPLPYKALQIVLVLT